MADDFKPILCVDFDGVLHSYTSGWQGVDQVVDPPVPGAIEWLKDCTLQFRVAIYSSRSKDPKGVSAMKRWLVDNGMGWDIHNLEFPTQKPAAFLTVDDRAIRFEGTFPPVDEMRAFRPWNAGRR